MFNVFEIKSFEEVSDRLDFELSHKFFSFFHFKKIKKFTLIFSFNFFTKNFNIILLDF